MWKRNKDKKTGKEAMEAGAGKTDSAAPATDGGDDLSMEEILQSIRKIIADDEGDDAPETPAEKAPEKTNGKGTSMDDEDDVPGSDMLELTDMLSEDGTVVNVKEEGAETKAAKEDGDAADDAASFDILNQIDEALTDEEEPAEDTSEPAPVEDPPEPKAQEKAEETPAAEASAPVSNDDIDSLLSDEAAQATSAAFDKLKTADTKPKAVPTGALPPLRSGETIEGMIQEMLQPMLKAWLDENLSGIVEEIVEREVKKLTR